MSITSFIQLALGVMRMANWIASRIDQAAWKRSGQLEAAAAAAREWNRVVGLADAAVAEAKAMTPEKQNDILESDL